MKSVSVRLLWSFEQLLVPASQSSPRVFRLLLLYLLMES